MLRNGTHLRPRSNQPQGARRYDCRYGKVGLWFHGQIQYQEPHFGLAAHQEQDDVYGQGRTDCICDIVVSDCGTDIYDVFQEHQDHALGCADCRCGRRLDYGDNGSVWLRNDNDERNVAAVDDSNRYPKYHLPPQQIPRDVPRIRRQAPRTPRRNHQGRQGNFYDQLDHGGRLCDVPHYRQRDVDGIWIGGNIGHHNDVFPLGAYGAVYFQLCSRAHRKGTQTLRHQVCTQDC